MFLFLENKIDGLVIELISNEQLSNLIPDLAGQIKFNLMMKHLRANQNKVLKFFINSFRCFGNLNNVCRL